jgi:glutamate N-acetyltransferase/amino-acid N-acetyltransferase
MPQELPVSPLAPKKIAKPKQLGKLRLSALASGARYKGRDDVLLVALPKSSTVAGVFTQSKMPSAAVDLSKANLRAAKGRARAILVNAGNANAFYRQGRRSGGGSDSQSGRRKNWAAKLMRCWSPQPA